MSEVATCKKCGTDLHPGSAGSICARCLLLGGLSSESGGFGLPAPPPPQEDIRAALPNYEIEEQIGRGAMGTVYRARHRTLDRRVALKILPAAIGADPSFSTRFLREAKTLAQLNHPNIVSLFEYGEADGLYFLALELVSGTTLAELIHAKAIAPADALRIVSQICDALQYAHDQGYVHRDIKPSNILVSADGQTKVADFGLAKLLDPERSLQHATLTRSDQGVGTPLYMAPEQRENGDIDHRADIYSLGVVFYEVLTGVLPTGNFPPPSKKKPIYAKFDRVVLRALASERDERFQNISEVKSAVENALHRKSRPWIVFASLAVLAIAAAGVLFATSQKKTVEPFVHTAPVGSVVAWGSNVYGDLSAVPDDLGEVVAVNQGGFVNSHTLAVRTDGTVRGWGNNSQGQINVPEGLDRVIAVDTGFWHSIALRDDGKVVSWGSKHGTPPADLTDVVAIAADGVHNLALKRDGTLASWGFVFLSELDIPEIDEKITGIDCGIKHRVAVTESGKILVWGSNTQGQCNLPDISEKAVKVRCGGYHSVALLADGSVVAWGMLKYGQGDVPPGNDFVDIAAGGDSCAAIRRDGSLVTWGWHKHTAPAVAEDISEVALSWVGGVAISSSMKTPAPPAEPAQLSRHRTFAQHPSRITSLAASADGGVLATIADDGVRVFTLDANELAQPLAADKPLTHLVMDPSGTRVACLNNTGEVLGAAAENASEWLWRANVESPSQIAISPSFDVAIGIGNGIEVLDASGMMRGRVATSATVNGLAFLDATTLACVSEQQVTLYEMSSAGLSEIGTTKNHGTCTGIYAAPDGRMGVTTRMGGISLIDREPFVLRSSFFGHFMHMSSELELVLATKKVDIKATIAFGEPGRLFSTGSDRLVRLWDLESGLLIAVSEEQLSASPSIVTTPGGAVTIDDNSLVEWKFP